MAWFDAALILAAAALCGVTAMNMRRLGMASRALSEEQRCQAALTTEVVAMQRLTRQMRDVQKFAESAVDIGASTVQTVHRTIAGVPFDVLESLPATRDTARVVRGAHDAISGAVYDTIRGINRHAGKAARGVINPAPRPTGPGRRAVESGPSDRSPAEPSDRKDKPSEP